MFSLRLFDQSSLFEVFGSFYVVILTHVITRGLQGFISATPATPGMRGVFTGKYELNM